MLECLSLFVPYFHQHRRVDPEARGRDSIRLESKDHFREGLVVIDAHHMPTGCDELLLLLPRLLRAPPEEEVTRLPPHLLVLTGRFPCCAADGWQSWYRCGTWSAFWMYEDPWPDMGEVPPPPPPPPPPCIHLSTHHVFFLVLWSTGHTPEFQTFCSRAYWCRNKGPISSCK